VITKSKFLIKVLSFFLEVIPKILFSVLSDKSCRRDELTFELNKKKHEFSIVKNKKNDSNVGKYCEV
jgi:hypothetical protein